MLKSIDLFAGIGGIRLGFENAFGDELKTVFVSEWDEYAQKTYKANFHDDFEIAGDITKRIFPTSIYVLRDSLVRHSVWQDSARALKTIIKECLAARCFSTWREFAPRKNRK